MKFLTDENISAKLIVFLRPLGHDVRSIDKGTDDFELAVQAKAESRIILTHDTDFADTRRHPPSSHVGIILLRINPLYIEIIKSAVINLLEKVPEAQLRNRRYLVFENIFVDIEENPAVS